MVNPQPIHISENFEQAGAAPVIMQAANASQAAAANSQPRQVKVDDLVVLDFKSEHLTDDIRRWKEEKQLLFSMSCARQVWYGHEEDLADFPGDIDGKKFKLRRGQQAYAFLLSFAAGFEDSDYSTHNRAQFFECWQMMQRLQPEKAAQYTQMMRDIELDSKLVQNAIINDYKKPDFELAARDLSGQQKGKKVLIIADITNGGNLSDFTKRMILATEQKQRQKDGHDHFITLTHPDPAKLEAIRRAIGDIKNNRTELCCIRSNIDFIPFADVVEAVNTHDYVYVTMPMDEDRLADQYLIEAWLTRERSDNSITHMRGKPSNQGLSVEPWTSAGLDNYISVEDVRAEKTRRNLAKKDIWRDSHEAFDVCAELRSIGVKPTKLNLFPDRRSAETLELVPAG